MDLPPGPYAIVNIDPPWEMGFGARMPRGDRTDLCFRWAPLPYRTMSEEAISALNVKGLLADDAWVCLWVPASRLGAARTVMSAWGVRAVGWRVWHKTDGGPQLPQKWRSDAEFVLIGAVGKPRWLSTRGFGCVFRAERERRQDPCLCDRRGGPRRCTSCPPRFWHSAKPSAYYIDMATRTRPPRLDMFARTTHAGWDAWGDEAPSCKRLRGGRARGLG